MATKSKQTKKRKDDVVDDVCEPPSKKRRKVLKHNDKENDTCTPSNDNDDATQSAAIQMYLKYYQKGPHGELGSVSGQLWETLKNKYNICKALYPGSFIDIKPSFYFDYVVYVDNNKNAQKFFAEKNKDDISSFIITNKNKCSNKSDNDSNEKDNDNSNSNSNSNSNKSKNDEESKNDDNDNNDNQCEYEFYYQDYNNDIKNEKAKSFDLLISLYAGFVTDNNLKYVKKHGYILVNNSHNDAFNCFLKKDEVKLIGVVNHGHHGAAKNEARKWDIDTSNDTISKCFIASKKGEIKKVESFKQKKHMKTIKFDSNYDYYLFEKK